MLSSLVCVKAKEQRDRDEVSPRSIQFPSKHKLQRTDQHFLPFAAYFHLRSQHLLELKSGESIFVQIAFIRNTVDSIFVKMLVYPDFCAGASLTVRVCQFAIPVLRHAGRSDAARVCP